MRAQLAPLARDKERQQDEDIDKDVEGEGEIEWKVETGKMRRQ